MTTQKGIPVSEIIKATRLAVGWSQKKLAESVGLSQQAIALIESDKRKVGVDLFLKLINTLDPTSEKVDKIMDTLLVSTKTQQKVLDLQYFAATPDETIIDTAESILLNDLVNDFDKLNPLGKEEACKRVNELTQIDRYTSIEYDES